MKYPTKAQREQAAKIWAKVIAKAWSDEKFKKRLLSRTEEVLKEYGLQAPGNATLKIVENTEETENLILPKKPLEELTTKEMQALAAAGNFKLAFDETR